MNIDEGMRVKLKSEIVSPFRRFRQFILFGVLASAGLGTFTAIPQLLNTLNNPDNPKIPLETAYQNVAIDIVGLLGSAYFLFKDFSSEYTFESSITYLLPESILITHYHSVFALQLRLKPSKNSAREREKRQRSSQTVKTQSKRSFWLDCL